MVERRERSGGRVYGLYTLPAAMARCVRWCRGCVFVRFVQYSPLSLAADICIWIILSGELGISNVNGGCILNWIMN